MTRSAPNQSKNPGREFTIARALLENAHSLVLLLTPDGTIVDLNQQMADSLGQPREKLIGTLLWPHLPPDSCASRQALIQRVVEERQPYRHDTESKGRWYDSTLTPCLGDQGQVLRLAIVAQDITQHKRAEHELQEQRNLLASVIEGTNVGTWRWNVQTGETEFSERWAGIIGYTLAELAPISIRTWLDLAHPDDLKESEALLKKHFDGALERYDSECRMQHKNGSWIWVHDRGRVIEWTSNGKPLVMTGTHSDITTRKQAEAALRRSAHASELLRNSLVAINACPDLDSALACLVQKAIELGGMDAGGAYLIEGQDAVLQHQVGLDPAFVEQVARRPLSTSYLKAALDCPQEIHDVLARFPEQNQFGARFGLRHVYCIGLVAEKRPFGILNVVSRQAAPPSASDIELIRILALETESLFVRLNVAQRLRRLTNEQRIILDNLPVGIGHLKYRKVQWASPAHDAIFGYEPGTTVGMDTASFFASQEEYERVGKDGYEQLAKGGAYATEAQMRKKDGSIFWCNLVGRAITPSNTDEGSIWMIQDFSERKRMGEALRQSEERLTLALRATQDAVWDWNLLTNALHYSPAWWSMFGYETNELEADPELWRRLVHPEDLERANRIVSEAIEGKDSFVVEVRVLHKQGHYVPVLTRGFVLRDNQGRAVRVSGTNTDLTEQKRAEEEHRQLEERLRQSVKMEGIGHMAGGMAHEFNNILAAMMLNLDLTRMLSAGAEAQGLLHDMETSCQRAADLIKKLLAFSRQSVMQRQPMDLAAAVSQQCKMLDRLLGERIALEFSSTPALPWVNADPAMIEQVLLNLCLNARDAMKNGGRLELRLTEVAVGPEQAKAQEGAQAGRYVCLSVADTGCGMDERTMKRLFEPFFTTKDVGQGPGLGLATARGIVQQHHGWVEVESWIGKGSTLRVYLPAVAQPLASPPVSRHEAPVRGHGTILLVEDEPMLRKSTRTLLVRTGYTVLEAADGREALALWQARRAEIDLVFTDMVMPGDLTGLQLAENLLADKPGLKAILTSGYNTELPDLSKVAESSIIYLPKPCPPGTLLSLIAECLHRK